MRYHGLDALRGAMMLLGLVLHSGASYTLVPIGQAWPFHDRQTSIVFDLLLFFIHLFRMPVFFVVAGFFAALLYERDGPPRFARNRATRVALPLVLFWTAMMPLLVVGLAFAARQTGAPLPWTESRDLSILKRPILAHFWFLYDLLIFYAAALAVVPAARALPDRLRRWTDSAFRRMAPRAWTPIVLGLVSMATLLPMEAPALETSAVLLPPARVLAAYAVFFAFGWLLFRHRDLLAAFGESWTATLGAGLAGSVVYLLVLLSRPFMDPQVWHLSGVAVAGVSIWLLIYGWLGLFLRHADRPRPLIRYFSDASYWMYLTHLVPVTWTAALLARAALPAAVKFAIVLSVTTTVTLVTYQLLVRFTALGILLNGRKQARPVRGTSAVAIES